MELTMKDSKMDLCVSKGGSLWAAAVRSTAIFTPSPEGRGQGVGQLCMELTMKDGKMDLHISSNLRLDISNRQCYNISEY